MSGLLEINWLQWHCNPFHDAIVIHMESFKHDDLFFIWIMSFEIQAKDICQPPSILCGENVSVSGQVWPWCLRRQRHAEKRYEWRENKDSLELKFQDLVPSTWALTAISSVLEPPPMSLLTVAIVTMRFRCPCCQFLFRGKTS